TPVSPWDAECEVNGRSWLCPPLPTLHTMPPLPAFTVSSCILHEVRERLRDFTPHLLDGDPMATGLLLTAAAASALLTAALPAHNPSSGFVDPPPDKIVIKVATVNGSGCPQGTTAVAVSEDNTAFTVTYSDYLAQAGGDSPPTAFRKNCQL